MEIDNRDPKKMNFIIDYLIDNDYRVDVDIMHQAKIYYQYADHDAIENDFKRIVRFMSKYKMIDIIDDEGYYLAKINLNTQEVKDLGIDEYISEFNKKNKISFTDCSINIKGDNKGYANQSSSFSNSPQTNSITENQNQASKKNFIMKVWKLVSENKLISSIISVIILYLIKIYFKIEF